MKVTNTSGASEGVPARHIEAFLEHLRTARYSKAALSKKRWVVLALSRWMKRKNIAMAGLDESAFAFFVHRLGRPPAARVRFEFAVLRLFLAYLRDEAVVHFSAPCDESAIANIHRNYVDYLKQDRGLAKNSVLVYAPLIRDFLGGQDAGNGHVLPDAFDAITIRNHILARSKGRSGEYIRLMTVALAGR